MKSKIRLRLSDEGVAASVPGLPGCRWQLGGSSETPDSQWKNSKHSFEQAARPYRIPLA